MMFKGQVWKTKAKKEYETVVAIAAKMNQLKIKSVSSSMTFEAKTAYRPYVAPGWLYSLRVQL